MYKSIGIIGSSGFIGSQLSLRSTPLGLYGRKNIHMLHKSNHDLLICAGAPAEKWKANLDPIVDGQNLRELANAISKSGAQKTVLISTIDVLGHNSRKSEDSLIDEIGLEPYGFNRLKLEQEVQSMFPETLVVRLPGMFGPGLKKNIIFDLLHSRPLPNINPESSFQWYDVRALWGHLLCALHSDLNLVHMATEPISVKDLLMELAPERLRELDNSIIPTRNYEMETNFAQIISGRSGKFLYSTSEIMCSIKDWFLSVQEGKN